MINNKIILEDIETIINSGIDWKRFDEKTVLISGANGFLAAYMVETMCFLQLKGIVKSIRILALVRNIEKAKKRFSQYAKFANLFFIVQDVCDPIKINEKVDFIIHAASQASPKFYGIDPVGTLSANVLGTINLLKFAQTQTVESFLYFSSSEVYGVVDESIIPTKENEFGTLDPTDVRSCYAESKRMGENICVSYFYQHSIPTKIVRPFHTYGPGMDLNDGRVYADFVSNILGNKDIIMKSDGLAMRAFCYLTDAAIGFFKVLLDGKNGEAYNVGNPNCESSIVDLAQLLVNMFPKKNLQLIKTEQTNNNYIKSMVLRNSPEISKMNKLGWFPKTNLKDGFYRTVHSYE
jgi:nucleoside-diphosphate-sugar epimerase